MVFIDLPKAFDTARHSHIITALRQKGVNQLLIALNKNMYHNICTHIFLKNEQFDLIGIQTGVKQSDPMSPILFNLSLDSLLWKSKEKGEGFLYCSKSISIVAFADDLVLLSGSWAGMQKKYLHFEDIL